MNNNNNNNEVNLDHNNLGDPAAEIIALMNDFNNFRNGGIDPGARWVRGPDGNWVRADGPAEPAPAPLDLDNPNAVANGIPVRPSIALVVPFGCRFRLQSQRQS